MTPWPLIARLGCALLMTSCAKPYPSLTAAPQLSLADEARAPCALYILPPHPTLADLEIGYVTRGAQIVACDAARRLAVETYEAQGALSAGAPPR